MKKINFKPINAIAIIAFSILLFGGCSKDNNSTEEFLDLNLTNFNQTKAGSTSGTANLNQMTTNQAAIYYAATKRLEQHLTKLNGQYVINVRNGSEVHISERLFNYYMQNLLIFNSIRNNVLKNGNKFVEIRPNKFLIVPKGNNFNFILTKGGGYGEGEGEEDPLEKPGGTTDVFFQLGYIEFYVSSSTLNELAFATGGVSLLTSSIIGKIPLALLEVIPQATIIAWATFVVSGITALGFNYLLNAYPNGVIFTYTYFGTEMPFVRAQNPVPDNK